MKLYVMKFIYLILSISLYSEITNPSIQSQFNTSYNRELLELEIVVPGASENNKLEINLDVLQGEAVEFSRKLSHTSSINRNSGEVSSFSIYTIEFVPLTEGPVVFQVTVTDLENPSLILSSEPYAITTVNLPSAIDSRKPFLHPYLSKTNYYNGEFILLSYTLFYGDEIGDLSMSFPELGDIDVNFTNEFEMRMVFPDNLPIELRSLPTAIFSSFESGKLLIPAQLISLTKINEQNINRETIAFTTEAVKLIIEPLPENDLNSSEKPISVGEGFDMKLRSFPQRVNYGEEIEFSIHLKGNANLKNITSLIPYINIPSFLKETVQSEKISLYEGELTNGKVFNYKGVSRSFIGYRFGDLEISHFNTVSTEWEMKRLNIPLIAGNVSYWQSLIFISLLIIFIVLISIIIIFKYRKKQKEFTTPVNNISLESGTESELKLRYHEFVEKYSLTLREGEILNILSTGKSTKEIAEQLFISPETIKKHIRNIMGKTNTHSRYEIYVLYTEFINKR